MLRAVLCACSKTPIDVAAKPHRHSTEKGRSGGASLNPERVSSGRGASAARLSYFHGDERADLRICGGRHFVVALGGGRDSGRFHEGQLDGADASTARSAAANSSESARRRAARAAFASGGTWSARAAAGVPSRLRVRETRGSCEKPTWRASVAGVREVLLGLAGEAHDNVGGQRDGGDASPAGSRPAGGTRRRRRGAPSRAAPGTSPTAGAGARWRQRRPSASVEEPDEVRRSRPWARRSRCGSGTGASPGPCRSAVARPAGAGIGRSESSAAVVVRAQIDAGEHDLAHAGLSARAAASATTSSAGRLVARPRATCTMQ